MGLEQGKALQLGHYRMELQVACLGHGGEGTHPRRAQGSMPPDLHVRWGRLQLWAESGLFLVWDGWPAGKSPACGGSGAGSGTMGGRGCSPSNPPSQDCHCSPQVQRSLPVPAHSGSSSPIPCRSWAYSEGRGRLHWGVPTRGYASLYLGQVAVVLGQG